MSDMAMTIEELRAAAAAIREAADWLAETFSSEAPPATEPSLTLEEVRAILAEKSRAGYTAQVKALLQTHGAATLSGVDPSEYNALIRETEALGNG